MENPQSYRNSNVFESGLRSLIYENPPSRSSKIKEYEHTELMRYEPVTDAQRFFSQDDFKGYGKHTTVTSSQYQRDSYDRGSRVLSPTRPGVITNLQRLELLLSR